MDRDILDGVLTAVAASVGAKFVYARVGRGVKHHQAKRGFSPPPAALFNRRYTCVTTLHIGNGFVQARAAGGEGAGKSGRTGPNRAAERA